MAFAWCDFSNAVNHSITGTVQEDDRMNVGDWYGAASLSSYSLYWVACTL